MRRFACIFVVVFFTGSAFAADPGPAIGRGRQALNEHRYNDAIEVLQGAIPDATTLAEPQHSQALAAIHFFSALAFFGLQDDVKTREELQQFFAFNPQARALDPARYDQAFIKTFNNVKAEPRTEQETGGSNFDEVYPGYGSFREREPRVALLEQWGDGPDLQLLGSAAEKREWRKLSDDDARRAFIESFWKSHDKTPETAENEYRKEFQRRVAFADETFRTARSRGSLTDRGRVFVLLGPPRVIRQKPLTAREGALNRVGGSVPSRRTNPAGPETATGSHHDVMVAEANQTIVAPDPDVSGTVERWIFARQQLPKTIPDAEVTFKFITQQGYGDHVLQRELLTNKVLGDAGMMN